MFVSMSHSCDQQKEIHVFQLLGFLYRDMIKNKTRTGSLLKFCKCPKAKNGDRQK